ncbi:MAG: PRC-barrel domain-containing protein [Burkholderiales bacterium]|nr:PRC-barrel domain-containing protein [Burkholderiales bacterium]
MARTTPDSIVDPVIESDLGRKPYAPIVDGDSYLHARAQDYDYWDDQRGPGPRLMAADTLQGDDVRNEADEKLGELAHIMIDVPTGRVAYGVLAVGGFLTIGQKLFAIPWSALRLDPANHCFRLSVSKERLARAEGFDQDAWPAMADRQWAESLHEYYEARPYWD